MEDLFCPDSPCIETQIPDGAPFLSRFPLYRDTNSCWRIFSVPIPPVSRHIFQLKNLFYPNPHISRHNFPLQNLFIPIPHISRHNFPLQNLSIPIPHISRHNFPLQALFCPDPPLYRDSIFFKDTSLYKKTVPYIRDSPPL